MKVDIPVHSITIKDENSGEQRTITTLREVAEIAEMLEETERDLIEGKVEEQVADALAQIR